MTRVFRPRRIALITTLSLALLACPLLRPRSAAADDSPLITDPALLDALEDRGLSFSARFESTAVDNAGLLEHPGYEKIVAVLEEDLEALRKADKQLGVGMAWAHRLFDPRWLSSPDARYELIGIVPRIDRIPFHSGTCGELRTIYRLAYSQTSKGVTVRSKLPMTVNVVTWLLEEPGSGCKKIAAKWLAAKLDADALAGPDGPLAPEYLAFERMKSLEVNLQAVRWPSTVRPELGNHAEYLLRVFLFPTRSPQAPVLGTLENTPDRARLTRDPELRAELRDWIVANHLALDEGRTAIPEKFLATRAMSVAPRGSERVSNHPFSLLFDTKDFSALPFESHRFTKTPAAFLRRLDDLSCTGCHQHRSIAGFHFLGEEARDAFPGNALAVRGSPHLISDLPRRRSYLAAAAEGRALPDARPLSERAEDEPGHYGARCGLGDPSFARWTCEGALRCASTGDDLVGECLPPGTGQTGDPCQPSTLVSFADSRKDSTRNVQDRACAGFCETTRVGFPRGMCSNGCEAKSPDGVCGSIAILQPFNACLGNGRPFEECLSENVRPAELRRCDEKNPCRDDYVCARAGESGGCIPPYFLFQLRVDGHPTGREGLSGKIMDRIERTLR